MSHAIHSESFSAPISIQSYRWDLRRIARLVCPDTSDASRPFASAHDLGKVIVGPVAGFLLVSGPVFTEEIRNRMGYPSLSPGSVMVQFAWVGVVIALVSIVIAVGV